MRKIFAIVGALVAAGTAQAQLITFGFTDMAGAFDASGSSMSIDVSAVFGTSGDVTLRPAMGTALFDTGFGLPADISFDLSIGNVTATTADATSGQFSIIDADGDAIQGGLTGMWTDQGTGFSFFDGTLSMVQIQDLGGADGQFDGPSGGSFDISSYTGQAWSGGVSFLMPTPAGFFTSDFDDNVTLVDGVIEVPAPAGAAVLAGLGLAGVRRRRR